MSIRVYDRDCPNCGAPHRDGEPCFYCDYEEADVEDAIEEMEKDLKMRAFRAMAMGYTEFYCHTGGIAGLDDAFNAGFCAGIKFRDQGVSHAAESNEGQSDISHQRHDLGGEAG